MTPSTPIDECLKDCTAAERAALAAHTPPYDGVRTWGDLEAVRGIPGAVVMLPRDATEADVAAARKKIRDT
jgi:hypothetical protein